MPNIIIMNKMLDYTRPHLYSAKLSLFMNIKVCI